MIKYCTFAITWHCSWSCRS